MESTPNQTNDRHASTHKTPSRTPRGQAIGGETPTSRRPVHTPLDRTGPRNLNSVRRGTSASGGLRRDNAPTPHAKAARRALNDRRAAIFTPGRNRRRSLMNQRESPHLYLQRLAPLLAKTTRPISSSSSSSSPGEGDTDRFSSDKKKKKKRKSGVAKEKENDAFDGLGDLDDDDDLPIKVPRMSLPIDDDDDEDELRVPRLSDFVEQDNLTVQSIELPRRVNHEQMPRLSRGSLGSMRGSEYFNPDEPTGELRRESDFFPGFLEDLQTREAEQDDLERIEPDVTRPSMFGERESDFGLEMPVMEDQTTFVLSEPALDTGPQMQSDDDAPPEAGADSFADQGSPLPGDDGNDMPDPVDDFSDREPFEDLGGDADSVDGSVREGSDEGGLSDAAPDAAPDVFSDRGSDMGDGDVTATTTIMPQPTRRVEDRATLDKRLLKKRKLVSHLGIEYPSLPAAFVKRVAQTAMQSSGLSNKKISTDTLVALTQASEWFFEQLGDDLGAYATHAKRKTIEDADVATLMRRQRLVGSSSTLFSLAQKHLPRELLQDLRMPLPQPAKQRRTKRPREEEES